MKLILIFTIIFIVANGKISVIATDCDCDYHSGGCIIAQVYTKMKVIIGTYLSNYLNYLLFLTLKKKFIGSSRRMEMSLCL